MEKWSNMMEFCMPLIVGLIGYGVKFLGNMAKSIGDLSTSMKVIIERVDNQAKTLDTHEERIQSLEEDR